MLDLIIKNGQIIDGTGAEAFFADIGIENGKIVFIGDCKQEAKMVIDAAGLVVTPGFIDSHSHADNAVVDFPEQREKCEQGITTSVAGQCGSSYMPKIKASDEARHSAEGFFKKLDTLPLGANIVTFVGHGTVRSSVMGLANREPTEGELEQMKELVRESVKAGALGVSFGLIYVPSCYAKTAELVEIAKACKEAGGMVSAHIRGEGEQLVDSVKEFIHIVKESGVKGVISHHKAAGAKNHGKTEITLKLIEEANAEGADIYCDVYPYIASSTSLSSKFVPKEYHADNKMLQNLADPAIRAQIKARLVTQETSSYDGVLVTVCKGHPEFQGKTLPEIAKMLDCDCVEAALRVIEFGRGSASACYFTMNESDVERVMAYPRSMICTDSSVARNNSVYHPRLRASFPRAIGEYCRNRGVVPLAEMIRKITSLPAHVYGLEGKGIIREGYDADICIFDSDKIIDKATYEEPTNRCEGLSYVIISGEIASVDAVYTGSGSGRAIRRKN
ncbi:MAG: D-aminoacylase [Clostridia bacterium]|nr:D-aminoacylase [Clostridia bacterium]